MLRLFSKVFLSPLILCLLIILFFALQLLSGKAPIPADSILGLYHPWRDNSFEGYDPGKFPTKNPLITDPVLQTYPWRKLAIENIKKRNLPLWNPYSFSGQPLLANIQSSPFQVLNILFFIFPFNLAWVIQIILTQVLVSIFAYLFLRNLKISQLASMFGSSVLALSGFFIVWMEWGTVVTTAMWLPLMLLSLKKLFNEKSAFWFAILAFASSQTIFSGHWQIAFYVFMAAFLYIIYNFYNSRNSFATLITLSGIFLGVLISSIQIFPTLEFINLSARTIDQSYSISRQDWFLPFKHLIQLVAPDFFGNPATYNYWGVWNYAEFASFIGIVPLGFTLFAILKKPKTSVFFIGLTILSLLLVLENPLSKIPYQLNLPFIASSQPSRGIFLLVFSLSILSAIGFQGFIDDKKNRNFLKALILPLALFIILIYTALFYKSFPTDAIINPVKVALRNLLIPLGTSIIFVLIFVLKIFKVHKYFLVSIILLATITELFRFGYKFTPFSKLSWIFPQTQTTNYLQNQQKPFRILSTDRRIFNGNTPSVYGIEAVHGYDPLFLKNYTELVSFWQSENISNQGSFNRFVTPEKFDSPITNLLNVKYVVTFDDIQKPGFEKVNQEGQTKIFINKNSLPRAFFVNEVTNVQSREQELKTIFNQDFNYNVSAVSTSTSFTKKQFSSKVEFINYSDQNFKLQTTSDNNAPLVISNIFYPGWHALIDGKEVEIHRANYIFQLVFVPQGQHILELKFSPQSFYNGLYLSTGGFLLTVVFTLYLWRKKYQ